MVSHWVPEHSTSHNRLLDFSNRSPEDVRFGAILVPTNRPVRFLKHSIDLASRTGIPLIVACSKRVKKHEVAEAAAGSNVQVFAVDLSPQQISPFDGISFATSTDDEILEFTSGLTRDLSAKRNLGLVVARMCGWERLMFLDDDIQELADRDVASLTAGLDDHNVSVLIPDEYPDNSVVCHAYRLGGGVQGRFASAGSMGVRCDPDELSFFPNIYNEDWFFFSEDAANHKIVEVGTSQQMEYNPYADPRRAVKEEFGDLLAEGLYARLDHGFGLFDTDAAYWEEFINGPEPAHRSVRPNARLRWDCLPQRHGSPCHPAPSQQQAGRGIRSSSRGVEVLRVGAAKGVVRVRLAEFPTDRVAQDLLGCVVDHLPVATRIVRAARHLVHQLITITSEPLVPELGLHRGADCVFQAGRRIPLRPGRAVSLLGHPREVVYQQGAQLSLLVIDRPDQGPAEVAGHILDLV